MKQYTSLMHSQQQHNQWIRSSDKRSFFIANFFWQNKKHKCFWFFCLSRLSGKRVNKSFLSFFLSMIWTDKRKIWISKQNKKKLRGELTPSQSKKVDEKTNRLFWICCVKRIYQNPRICFSLSREIFPDNPQTFYLST